MNLHASAHIDEQNHRVTMLYEILPGPAWRSYGIHVAQIANFPQEIIAEASRFEERILGEPLQHTDVSLLVEHPSKRIKVA